MNKVRIFYVTYCGLPLSLKEKGTPIHATSKGDLLPLDWIVEKAPKLKKENLALEEMSAKDFYSQKWPS